MLNSVNSATFIARQAWPFELWKIPNEECEEKKVRRRLLTLRHGIFIPFSVDHLSGRIGQLFPAVSVPPRSHIVAHPNSSYCTTSLRMVSSKGKPTDPKLREEVKESTSDMVEDASVGLPC